ncbi:3-hydroxybutyryl-CoA dehydrogenase [Noviherbaspirillum saxi]|uniref:3-hydroxybutyryl-CoA dehydrogenase n=1 Tax=Noviherbaspirillum saxi TaxID=2320863 RepID=A0A3A3FX58_9BURK|nr:3-hydroxybutyryl-CoA dehydrogenase [Noviherbaspirillum saxi]RJF91659.1 3-hydroxybutyryl-CoA dehydrogenase [Noviherbaspirillum saxi]
MHIQHIGIIGAGQMGSGIAQICASAGLDVTLRDVSDEALQRALSVISSGLDRAVKSGKINAEQKAGIIGRIRTSTEIGALASSDFIIEAATEQLELKQRILKETEAVVKSSAIIASNTSSVSITKLGASLTSPERFVGMHFFNPVPVMSLVEVIRGIRTSDSTSDTTRMLAEKIGKTPISVRNSPGFVVNRILVPMINEAVFVLQDGLATAEEIDAGMKLGANHPIGPLALADLIGLDTCLTVMEVFYRDFNDPKYRPAPLLREMVDAGTLGRKTGSGFYQYV